MGQNNTLIGANADVPSAVDVVYATAIGADRELRSTVSVLTKRTMNWRDNFKTSKHRSSSSRNSCISSKR